MGQKLNPRRKNVKNSLLDGGSSEFWMGIGGVSGRCSRAEEKGPGDRARRGPRKEGKGIGKGEGKRKEGKGIGLGKGQRKEGK
jgi:hypothetical protein